MKLNVCTICLTRWNETKFQTNTAALEEPMLHRYTFGPLLLSPRKNIEELTKCGSFALRRLWILREIRRCSKITLARLALWNKVMNSNEIRRKPFFDPFDFRACFPFLRQNFEHASWNLTLRDVKPPKVQWSPVWPFNLGKWNPR